MSLAVVVVGISALIVLNDSTRQSASAQDIPPVEILTPTQGQTNVPTPLVVTGRINPALDYESITISLNDDRGFSTYNRDLEVDADGRWEWIINVEQDTDWDRAAAYIQIYVWPGNGQNAWADRVDFEFDMSKRRTGPPDVTWNLPTDENAVISNPFDLVIEGGSKFPIATNLKLTVYDESDQVVFLSHDGLLGEWIGDTGERTNASTTITVDVLSRIASFDGPRLRFELEVSDGAPSFTHLSGTVLVDLNDFEPAVVTVDTPTNLDGVLQYPVIVAGTARGGSEPPTEVRVSIGTFQQQGNDPNSYVPVGHGPLVNVDIQVDKEGRWFLFFDPRYIEGWTWHEDHHFMVTAHIIRTRIHDSAVSEDVLFRTERVDKYCAGFGVTVDLSKGQQPTEFSDIILGTPGRDVIRALGGNDIICADSGRDVVVGGYGHDYVDGGAGRDRIITGPGDDLVYGRGGPDRIRTGQGNDVVFGGAEDDRIKLGPGSDQADGQNGDDTILGDGGEDWILGGAGNDYIDAGRGPDHVAGGPGTDTGTTGNGNDECVEGRFNSCELNYDLR